MSHFRLALGVLGFLSALIAPSWAPMLFIVILSLRFRAIEALAIGFFTDMLWLAPSGVEGLGSISHALPLYTIAAVIIVWGLEPLRLEFLR